MDANTIRRSGQTSVRERLDGNTRSWLDPNRRSAHRVDLPGWAEPRRGAVRSPAQLSRLRETRRSCHTPVVRYGGSNGRSEKREGGRHMAAVMTTPRIELEPAVTRTVRRGAPPPAAP